jgi:hypothetical protein
VLRPGLLHELLQDHGGFTINPRSGRRVDRGISVCADPHLSLRLSGWDDVAVAGWLTVHAASYTRPDRYVGGWSDPTTGHLWLDVVRLLPSALLHAALHVAHTHGQRGVFDLSRHALVLVQAS